MRAAGGTLSTFLDANTKAWFADLFTWTPVSGGPYYWTNWTHDLWVGGHLFVAAGTGTVPLVEVDGYKASVGTDIETTTVTLSAGSGAQFGGVRLPLAAAQGMFDGCGLLVERLFMATPGDVSLGTLHVFQGIVGDVDPSSSEVQLTVESGMAALNQVLPRTLIQASCNNVLFDTVCAAAGLTKASKTVTGTCAAGATNLVVPTSRTGDANGYFELGVITFTSGVCAGASRGVVKSLSAAGQMTLDRPLPGVPANGDTFSIYPGCDKARTGGCAKFLNVSQFRGFPFAPSKGTTYQPVVTSRIVKGHTNTTTGRSTAVGTGGYGAALPIVYGLQRVSGKLIFVMPPAKRGNTFYADQIMALCQGVITSVLRAWRNGAAGTLAQIYDLPGLAAVVVTGTDTQAPWSRVTSLDPTEALAYPGVAYVGLPPAAYTPSDVQSRSFEVAALFYNGLGGAGDAHPADVIPDLLTSVHGAGLSFSVVTDAGQDGTAASSFRRYAAADNFGVSLLVDEQRPAKEILRDLLDSTNSDVVWSDGAFKIIPYADQVTTGNGVTFTPVTTPQYALGVDDFLVEGDEDPVSATRGPTIDLYNTFPVEFLERAPITWRPLTAFYALAPDQVVNAGNIYQCITDGITASSGGPTGTASDITDGTAHWKFLQAYDPAAAYNAATVESADPVDVATNKIKRAPAIAAHAICNRDSAVKLSRLYARRTLYSRTVYRFRLPYRFCRLEPMDLVSLTEPTFGLVGQMVRIQTITETVVNGAPVYEIEAVEWPVGFASSPAHLTGSNESMNYVGTGGAEMATATIAGAVAAALSTWIVGAIPYNASAWRSVAEMSSGYPGRIVAVGMGTAVAYSDSQGRAWTAGTIPAGDWYSVCAGGPAGLVAVGSNGATSVAATSADGGAIWTSRAINGTGSMAAVRWNGSRYVAVGTSGAGRWSTDGIIWNTVTLPTVNGINSYYDVAWSPLHSWWLAVGGNGASATSPDGSIWTGRGIDTASNPTLRGVAWSEPRGTYSVVAASGLAYTSKDGIVWHKTTLPGATDASPVVWGGGVFVAPLVNGAGRDSIAYSYDGVSWSAQDVSLNGNMYGTAYLQGAQAGTSRFITVGSTNGGATGAECAISGALP